MEEDHHESTAHFAPPDFDHEMRLSTNIPMDHDVRIIPGVNLSSRHICTLEEIDVEQTRKSSDVLYATKMQLFDITTLPLTTNMNNINMPINLNVDQMGMVKHLCNGSRSHLFRGLYNISQDNNIITYIPVILKIMIEAAVTDHVVHREFKNEIESLRRFNHSNILSIYGVGYAPSHIDHRLQRPFLVLESLNGDTLRYHLAKRRSFHSRPFTELRYVTMP